MLKQLSRLERTRGVIIVGFAFLMAASLIFFYSPGRNSASTEPAKDTTTVAEVGGDAITVADVSRLKENYLRMFGGSASIAQLGGYKRFVEGLIRDRVVAQEATRLGLAASDGEVAEKIRKQFADASGQVNMERYRAYALSNYGGVDQFERTVRDEISQDKLRAFVVAAVKVSDDEVQADFKRTNTEFGVSYSVVSADKLAEKIQVSDDDLKSYYDQHKDDFKIAVPQKKIRYLFIDQTKSGEKVEITDKDLHDEFGRLEGEAKLSGVKVQQILLKVARKDLDAQVEQKGKDLIAKIYAAPPEQREKIFTDAAKGQSEDPTTASAGGWLAKPFKKNPNKADGLYDRTIDMKPGDVSDIPIRYGGNWYVLRRGDDVLKTFDEAKTELLPSLRNRRGFFAASKLAEKAKNRLKEAKDPQKVAQELAAEANMKPADMVKETAFIKPGDDVPGIGSSQQFEAVVAPLNNVNDVGEFTQVKGGFAIPMLIDKKDPRVPDFAEVKSNVDKIVKQQRAKDQLEQKAKDLAASIGSAADLKAAAEKAGFEVTNEETYKLGSPLGKAGTSPALDEAIYAMKAGEVTKTPMKVGDSYVIAGVTTRKDADLAEYAKQRDRLTQQKLAGKQNQVYEDYITAVQQRMKQNGKIKIYSDVISALEESEPEVAPSRPQFPIPTRK
ncbi:MAG TPA: SurA N-terminal domain-containing protein [Pyrinomonadaceae bacterium]|nr:SurA N-terminal domain-containing protein [Pyrinomonadaceae bacterium]